MSTAWIQRNLPQAVPESLVSAILRAGYSRHILYVPFYLPAAAKHVEALTVGDEHGHTDHDVPFTHHYKEAEVAEAVKLKASRLKSRT